MIQIVDMYSNDVRVLKNGSLFLRLAVGVDLKLLSSAATHAAHHLLCETDKGGKLDARWLHSLCQEAHWLLLARALVSNKLGHALAAHWINLVGTCAPTRTKRREKMGISLRDNVDSVFEMHFRAYIPVIALSFS